MNRVEEQRLIARARRGDSEAFAALYRANVQAIHRYIYYRVNNAQLAEDLTGDVFMGALKSIREYSDTGRPFIAWLYRIAHARVVDHYRRAQRRPPESDIEDEPIAVSDDMDHELVRQQTAQVLKQALDGLTDEQQQVIVLRFIEGHSLEMVAQTMNKNANAIKALQHRALRALAGRLKRAGFDVEMILSGFSS